MRPRSINAPLRWVLVLCTTLAGTGLAISIEEGTREIWHAEHWRTLLLVFMLIFAVVLCMPLWLISYALLTRKHEIAVEMGALIAAFLIYCFWVFVEVQSQFAKWLQHWEHMHHLPRGGVLWKISSQAEVRLSTLILLGSPAILAGLSYLFCRKAACCLLFSPGSDVSTRYAG